MTSSDNIVKAGYQAGYDNPSKRSVGDQQSYASLVSQ